MLAPWSGCRAGSEPDVSLMIVGSAMFKDSTWQRSLVMQPASVAGVVDYCGNAGKQQISGSATSLCSSTMLACEAIVHQVGSVSGHGEEAVCGRHNLLGVDAMHGIKRKAAPFWKCRPSRRAPGSLCAILSPSQPDATYHLHTLATNTSPPQSTTPSSYVFAQLAGSLPPVQGPALKLSSPRGSMLSYTMAGMETFHPTIHSTSPTFRSHGALSKHASTSYYPEADDHLLPQQYPDPGLSNGQPPHAGDVLDLYLEQPLGNGPEAGSASTTQHQPRPQQHPQHVPKSAATDVLTSRLELLQQLQQLQHHQRHELLQELQRLQRILQQLKKMQEDLHHKLQLQQQHMGEPWYDQASYCSGSSEYQETVQRLASLVDLLKAKRKQYPRVVAIVAMDLQKVAFLFKAVVAQSDEARGRAEHEIMTHGSPLANQPSFTGEMRVDGLMHQVSNSGHDCYIQRATDSDQDDCKVGMKHHLPSIKGDYIIDARSGSSSISPVPTFTNAVSCIDGNAACRTLESGNSTQVMGHSVAFTAATHQQPSLLVPDDISNPSSISSLINNFSIINSSGSGNNSSGISSGSNSPDTVSCHNCISTVATVNESSGQPFPYQQPRQQQTYTPKQATLGDGLAAATPSIWGNVHFHVYRGGLDLSQHVKPRVKIKGVYNKVQPIVHAVRIFMAVSSACDNASLRSWVGQQTGGLVALKDLHQHTLLCLHSQPSIPTCRKSITVTDTRGARVSSEHADFSAYHSTIPTHNCRK